MCSLGAIGCESCDCAPDRRSPRCRIFLGLYQCLATVPSNFYINAPEGLEWVISLLEVPNSLGIRVLIPANCMGDYRRRLLITAMWHCAFVLVVVAIFICRGVYYSSYASGGWRRWFTVIGTGTRQ